MSNNSNFAAARCRDAVFHTTQTPTVCYSVPSIVEVSGGCQSVNIMSAQPRDYCSEIICILRKIHRLRKHPWISAQTMDDNGSTDCAGRSMDCADPQIAPNICTPTTRATGEFPTWYLLQYLSHSLASVSLSLRMIRFRSSIISCATD